MKLTTQLKHWPSSRLTLLAILGIFYFLAVTNLSATESNDAGYSLKAEKFRSTYDLGSHQKVIPIMVGSIGALIIQYKEEEQFSETLEGEDSDQNGVRDDIQNAIFARYTDSYIRDRTLLMAEAVQKVITMDTSNIRESLNHIERLDICINQKEHYGAGKAFVIPKMLNTYQRSIAFLENAREANLYSSTAPDLTCE